MKLKVRNNPCEVTGLREFPRIKSHIRTRDDIFSTATESEGETCSICLEELRVDCFRLNCNHRFHMGCVLSWFERNPLCPLCRKQLTLDCARRLVTLVSAQQGVKIDIIEDYLWQRHLALVQRRSQHRLFSFAIGIATGAAFASALFGQQARKLPVALRPLAALGLAVRVWGALLSVLNGLYCVRAYPVCGGGLLSALCRLQ